MNTITKISLAVAGLALAAQAGAQVTFYENDAYQGRSFTTERTVENFARFGFNDRASSAVVAGNRGDRWEVCEDRRFRGRCVVLRPGQYGSLAAMGLNDRVSSVRAVGRNARIGDDRYAPMPAPVAPPTQTSQVTFYENDGFKGRSFTADSAVDDLRRSGFNDRASSAMVSGGRWEVCPDTRFGGQCAILLPGQYPSLAAAGLNDRISSVRKVGDERPVPVPVQSSQIVFYEGEGFQGRTFSADTPVADLRRAGFNDRASSAVVSGSRWEVCDNTEFGGSCTVLRPGQYPSLAAMGLNDRISSVRGVGPNARVDEPRYAPLPVVSRDYGRRNNERLYEANITSVRAVVEDSGQRCWVEREQIPQERSNANVPGALLGAVIGGILGHQVGGGTGKDVATGIGVVAGAAIGGNAGRDNNNQQVVKTQNVQRCNREPSQARPAYWDVTYNFRGQDYHVQMTAPPSGSYVTVNDQGEPRA
nr:beta/gamma crystallin-related protein [uncultured Roseateles sp.]